MKADPRGSRRVSFQINLDRKQPLMRAVATAFGDFRTDRKLTAWAIDMWRLWNSLAKDEENVLVELFPNFAKRLLIIDNDLLKIVSEQQTEILTRIKDLEARGISTVGLQTSTPATGKPLSIGKIAMPTFDDEDTVVVNQDLTNDPVKNFLASFSSLGGDNGSTKES